MKVWEGILARVYAAALIWDGLRKSVRPIAVDALRTLANRLEGAEEIGEQLMPGECAHEQCRFRGMAHYGTHVID